MFNDKPPTEIGGELGEALTNLKAALKEVFTPAATLHMILMVFAGAVIGKFLL